MSAHQHCDLFYPLGWGSDWVYHKLGNTSVLQSGTGSWVLSGELGVRHPSSPVIRLGLRNPRKKERSRTRRKRTPPEEPPPKLINFGGGSSGGVLFLPVLDQGT